MLWNCKGGCSQEAVTAALVERGLLHEVRDAGGRIAAYHERKGRWLHPDFRVSRDGEISPKQYLYGLDEVLQADPERYVFIAEGEKARNALKRWGFLAVGTFGATTDPTDDLLAKLAGRRVYLFPDADEPGRQQARRLGATLEGLGIEAWRLDWPEAPIGGDAADLLEDCHDQPSSRSRMARLVEKAQRVGPADEGVTFERVELGYQAVFEDAQARFRIDNLVTGRGRELEGDLAIEARKTWGWRTVLSGRVTLRSLSSRESWTRTLGKMAPGVNWETDLARFCTDVMQAERALEAPMIRLRDARALPPDSFLVEPLVLGHDVTILYGNSGTGKSLLGLALALSTHLDAPLVGWRKPARQLRAAYLDFEFAAEVHKDRMARLLSTGGEGPDEELPDIAYFDCKGAPLGEQLPRLTRSFQADGIGFAILDSIGLAADGPLNDDETARRFFRQAYQLKVPVFAIAHVNKAGEELFGSAFWRHGCRLMWKIEADQDASVRGLALTLLNEKFNTGRRRAPLHLDVSFGEVYAISERSLTGEPSDNGTPLNIADTLAATIRRAGRALTYRQLAERAGVQENTVRMTVSRENKRFRVQEPAEGERQKRVGLVEQKPLPGVHQPSASPDAHADVSDANGRGESASDGPPYGVGVHDALPPPADMYREKGGSAAAADAAAPACPHCGDPEGLGYRPLEGGGRLCLSCEKVWQS